MRDRVHNLYFELTRELNAGGTIAVLSSGQAVVWYRLAMVSKDGDWIVRETDPACATILDVLARHGARYRPSAPLAVRWLAGGWSSHFEFADAKGRRIRCDFVSRPPRMDSAAVARLFVPRPAEALPVIDLRSLLAIKQTQRAKDYPVIGALARLLPPEEELCWTIDPDRILDLARTHDTSVSREAVRLARAGASRSDVVVAVAREVDSLQQLDRVRMTRYEQAAKPYLAEFAKQRLGDLPLRDAHSRVMALAAALLPAALGA